MSKVLAVVFVSLFMSGCLVQNHAPRLLVVDEDENTFVNQPTITLNDWEYLAGSTYVSTDNTDMSVMKVYFGTPYVAYRDINAGNVVKVKKYINGVWHNVGGAVSGTGVTVMSLLVENGVVYLAYTDSGDSKVKKFDGYSWVDISNGLPLAGYPSLSLAANNGTIYIAYADGKSYVRVYNPATLTWNQVGAAITLSGAYNIKLTIDKNNGDLYVGYNNHDVSDKPTVQKYNGSSWSLVGPAGIGSPTSNTYFKNIILDDAATPYVSYQDSGFAYPALIKAYDGSSWISQSSTLFGGVPLNFETMSVDNIPMFIYDDNLYTASVKAGEGNSISVTVCSGGVKNSVGSPYFSPSSQSVDMENYEDILYVSFVDRTDTGGGVYTNKLSVMKYGPQELLAPTINPDTYFTSAGTIIAVTITNNVPGSTLVYTTDGSLPTMTNGTVYSGTFNVTVPANVRAFSYDSSGLNASPVSEVYYGDDGL